MALPKRVFVHEEEDGAEKFLLASAENEGIEGRVGLYELVEELDSRTVVEVRRKGTKQWFKPSSSRA